MQFQVEHGSFKRNVTKVNFDLKNNVFSKSVYLNFYTSKYFGYFS